MYQSPYSCSESAAGGFSNDSSCAVVQPRALAYQYLASSFSSMAMQITNFRDRAERQEACLLHAIAIHTKTAYAVCFASDTRLLDRFNAFSPKYGLKTVKNRTLTTILTRLCAKSLVSRDTHYDRARNQRKRLLTINLQAIQSVYEPVYNLALSHAEALFNRINLRLGRSVVEKCAEPSNGVALSEGQESENCRTKIKNISKDNKSKTNIKPSYDFYSERFKDHGIEAFKLQKQAREGVINAIGAKRLIALHNKYFVELVPSFHTYLKSVIGNPDHTNHRADPEKSFNDLLREVFKGKYVNDFDYSFNQSETDRTRVGNKISEFLKRWRR